MSTALPHLNEWKTFKVIVLVTESILLATPPFLVRYDPYSGKLRG